MSIKLEIETTSKKLNDVISNSISRLVTTFSSFDVKGLTESDKMKLANS